MLKFVKYRSALQLQHKSDFLFIFPLIFISQIELVSVIIKSLDVKCRGNESCWL